MSNFKTPLVVSPLPDGKHWKLHTRFTYEVSPELLVAIPAGFVTDFASVPWPFWNFIRPWGKWGKAAVLHDFMYQNHRPFCFPANQRSVYRSEADWFFREAMEALGVAPWRRNLMYWGVRAFGWLAWRKKR
ncbi:hypothetical protein LCGC14_1491230 [marine sediment metagenome]|uniref:DUF1353 domain-containing protein n=1 Tax=marine sediment metagenome TaxID=412755 RepID=A0A0F9JSN1_9ZZZZ